MRVSLHFKMNDLLPCFFTCVLLVLGITACMLFRPCSFFLLVLAVNLLGMHESLKRSRA